MGRHQRIRKRKSVTKCQISVTKIPIRTLLTWRSDKNCSRPIRNSLYLPFLKEKTGNFDLGQKTLYVMRCILFTRCAVSCHTQCAASCSHDVQHLVIRNVLHLALLNALKRISCKVPHNHKYPPRKCYRMEHGTNCYDNHLTYCAACLFFRWAS